MNSSVPSYGAGQQVTDRYRILNFIGVGRFSELYLAEDAQFEREVALKRLIEPVTHRAFIDQCLVDIRLYASLPSKHVVHLHRYFEFEDHLFVDMEPMARSAASFQDPLPWTTLGPLMRDYLLALKDMHHIGVLHNDISPANLFSDRTGAGRLGDFIGAHGVRPASSEFELNTFVSPELIRSAGGEDNVPFSSDLYSLGLSAYWLLIGHKRAQREFEVIYKGSADIEETNRRWILWHESPEREVTPLCEVDKKHSEGLSEWVDAMTRKDPQKRLASVDQALDQFPDERTGPPKQPGKKRKLPDRKKPDSTRKLAVKMAKILGISLVCIVLLAIVCSTCRDEPQTTLELKPDSLLSDRVVAVMWGNEELEPDDGGTCYTFDMPTPDTGQCAVYLDDSLIMTQSIKLVAGDTLVLDLEQAILGSALMNLLPPGIDEWEVWWSGQRLATSRDQGDVRLPAGKPGHLEVYLDDERAFDSAFTPGRDDTVYCDLSLFLDAKAYIEVSSSRGCDLEVWWDGQAANHQPDANRFVVKPKVAARLTVICTDTLYDATTTLNRDSTLKVRDAGAGGQGQSSPVHRDKGDLLVTSIPDSDSILVDGQLREGFATPQTFSLTIGFHRVRLDHLGNFLQTTVEVKRDSVAVLDFDFENKQVHQRSYQAGGR